MEDLLFSSQMDSVRRRAQRRLGLACVSPNEGQDPVFLDAVARELYADKMVPSELRTPLMRSLIQPSGGGLLALSWLCANAVGSDRFPVEGLPQFAGSLPFGDSEPDALNEMECEQVVDGILRVSDINKVTRIAICVRLLSSIFMSVAGRNAALHKVKAINSINNDDKKVIFQWAMGLDVVDEIAKGFDYDIPLAPIALARAAVNCLVDSGYDAGGVIRHVVKNIECWVDSRTAVLNGLLDLLDRNPNELPGGQGGQSNLGSVRKVVLDLCIKQKDASLRRRAYRMGAKEVGLGKEYLQKALRDSDFNVRMWAIGQLKA